MKTHKDAAHLLTFEFFYKIRTVIVSASGAFMPLSLLFGVLTQTQGLPSSNQNIGFVASPSQL